LERLVAVANRHLVQLNPRYAMRRSNSGADDLELEIIDHYQGDVVRPMRSLSGGESFLASLALAVGLSELASGRTAIESLFIDEGFGSLDPTALEIAMAALEGLRTNGKTIGVISHVDAMKERIATQIQVHKREGGRSILEVRS
jgi:exonuclease SbcC